LLVYQQRRDLKLNRVAFADKDAPARMSRALQREDAGLWGTGTIDADFTPPAGGCIQ